MNTDAKNDKRTEKLKSLMEKREKAVSAQNAAEKKTKEINAQIAKLEKDIRNDEIKALDEFCIAQNINYADLMCFLSGLCEKMTLSDAAALLEIESFGKEKE